MGSPRRSSTGYRRATLGPQLLLKKNTFQGLVIPVAPLQQQQNVGALVSEALAKQPRLRKFHEFPRASRIRVAASKDCSPSGVDLVEECDDSTLIGVGDRLMYLLQRWQVTNVVLVVAHYDSSLSGRLLGGAELYKLSTEAAKLVLEQHYLDSVAEAAKFSAEGAASSTTENNQKRLQQVIPATCVMSSATVPTWPKHHQPTSDGGGRKGVKQGRINHFRHKEITAVASQAAASPLTVEGEEEKGGELQRQDDQEPAEEKASPVLRALQNVAKSPTSPSHKPLKIVDPGRLFGLNHATHNTILL
ncbi:hypothetical protein PF011_g22732 [Phytophthora fragariae]|uniref:Impact N-terminal domain-containing protein n=1 Tax=Phytophthora fragariae TaxID=53985 RepID=A0A6A3IE68_9STRA|nr:hypothetical protein PF011_g22732 [Phytophthora fragariae]KAE9292157.1 hypothetical protein PF008_g25143 [Phytophthora fragariae]